MLTRITDHVQAIKEPATAPWNLIISTTDFEKLKAGFEPQAMEDRWRISATTDQSQNGTISIHMIRSWTDKEIYILMIKPSDGGSSSGCDMKIEAITWESNRNGIAISEELAKKDVVLTIRRNLKCDFDTLPEYDTPDVLISAN